MADGEKQMNLRYPGRCADCGAQIAQGTRATYNSTTKHVRHLDCTPAASGEPLIDRGAAGASALREFERRQAKDAAAHDARIADSRARIQSVFGTGFFGRVATMLAVDDTPPRTRHSTKAWETGAIGEERVGARLDALAEVGVITLHDRSIPGSRANIDHVVITPWVVWVVDAKRYLQKKVNFDVVGGFLGIGGRKRLLVGGRDKTTLVDDVERQVALVQDAVGPGIEVNGCLRFVDSTWPLIGGDFSIRGVSVCWPKKLTRTLLRTADAVIDPEDVARRLAVAFPGAR